MATVVTYDLHQVNRLLFTNNAAMQKRTAKLFRVMRFRLTGGEGDINIQQKNRLQKR